MPLNLHTIACSHHFLFFLASLFKDFIKQFKEQNSLTTLKFMMLNVLFLKYAKNINYSLYKYHDVQNSAFFVRV